MRFIRRSFFGGKSAFLRAILAFQRREVEPTESALDGGLQPILIDQKTQLSDIIRSFCRTRPYNGEPK